VLNLEPIALVLRLVLNPNHLGCVRKLFKLCSKCLVREGIELLDANDRDFRGLAFAARIQELVVDLA
jgi:hypothetical protein